MNISSINARYLVSFFKESVLPTLTLQQKRILYVVSLVLSLLTTRYLISRYCFKAKKMSGEEDSQLEKIDQVVENSPLKLAVGSPVKSPVKSPVSSEKVESIESASEQNKSILKNKDPLISDDNGDIDNDSIVTEIDDLAFRTPVNKKKISFKRPSSEETKVKTPKKKQIFGQINPGDIQKLPRDLDELSLTTCSNLTDEDILDFPPNLKKLSISGGKMLTNKAVEYFPRTIIELSITNSPKINNLAIPHLPSGLVKFSVRAVDLNDEGIKLLSETLQDLEDLSLTGLPGVTIFNFEFKKIKKLSLTRCDITDEAIKDISRDLEEFTLIDCMRVTVLGLIDLPPKLIKLVLTGYDVPDEIREKFKDIQKQITPPTPGRRFRANSIGY